MIFIGCVFRSPDIRALLYLQATLCELPKLLYFIIILFFSLGELALRLIDLNLKNYQSELNLFLMSTFIFSMESCRV